MREGRERVASGQQGLARVAQRLAQLLEVLLVRERGGFVEPLGHHQLRAGAFHAPALGLGVNAHEGLGALRDRGRAEAEGQTQRDVALVQLDLVEAQVHAGHVKVFQSSCTCLALASAQPGPSGT